MSRDARVAPVRVGDVALRPETTLSLFSGIGALDLAIGRVFPGARTLCYVEREAYACAVLAARMEDGSLAPAPIWGDITTLPTGALRGRIDLVAGGFPCQDISLAGDGAGIRGERSGLFFDLMRVVRDVRPRYVFLENVSALTVRGLDAVLGALAEVGMSAEWGCLRASDVGAPHRRDRWWCLAWDRGQLADDHGRGFGERTNGAESESSGRGETRELAGRISQLADRKLGDAAVARRGQVSAEHREQPRSALDGSGECMGDPSVPRLALGGPLRRDVGAECQAAQRAGRAPVPYPPGPDDRDGWRAYLKRYPDLAPAVGRPVRGSVDGSSDPLDVRLRCECSRYRVDRLRSLGNAVVPQQAYVALRLLWRRAFGYDPIEVLADG